MPPALLQRTSSAKMADPSKEDFHQHYHSQSDHPMSQEPHDTSIIAYEDELERLNSGMQLAWSEVMDVDYYTTSTNYEYVEILMLSWEKEVDDLKVQQEIDDLTQVFQETYNYHVTRKEIKKREKKKAQTQINAIVANWVDQYDGLKTLLVVYFAGHGKPGKQMGELALSGYQSPSDVRNYLNTVVWNITENNLHEIQSDVLQIFDCCYAGALGVRGASQQSFEYLAATAADDTTASPGHESFTSALIWALKELAKNNTGRFTTVHLLEMIRQAPSFPQDQQPVLSKRRENPANERIILHQLKVGSPVTATLNGNGTLRRTARQQDVLTLKLIFESRPSEDDIRNLGRDLNHVVHQHKLHINRIMYGGIVPRENDAVFRAVSNFKALGSKSMKRKNGVEAGQYHSNAPAMAAKFVKHLQDEVEEHVHDQVSEEVHERVQEEIELMTQTVKRLEKSATNQSLTTMLE